jgi:hypothetical protein
MNSSKNLVSDTVTSCVGAWGCSSWVSKKHLQHIHCLIVNSAALDVSGYLHNKLCLRVTLSTFHFITLLELSFCLVCYNF